MISQEYPLLILLVGANPLPNYLVACALRPRRLALVYTRETQQAKDRLEAELKKVLGEHTSFVRPDPFVSDATCATTISRAIHSLMRAGGDAATRGDVWLSYTGGTKVMAAHARMAFQDAVGKEVAARHASYLDEGGASRLPRLRFDDGTEKELADYADVPLSLKTMLELHGITHEPRTPKKPAPTSEDAREILSKVLEDVTFAKRLYEGRQRLECKKPEESVDSPFRAVDHELHLSVPEIPCKTVLSSNTRKYCRSWYKQWYKFIGGEWLEEWVGEQILLHLELHPKPEITVGVNAKRGENNAPLEIDVAVIRGHRSYFISCTTDTTKPICKSKLFEVAVRSRQLGGDLARAALVCLADDKTVGELQADIDELWNASNVTKVFGLSDVKSWSDHGGKQPNLKSLEDWLES